MRRHLAVEDVDIAARADFAQVIEGAAVAEAKFQHHACEYRPAASPRAGGRQLALRFQAGG